MQDHNRTPVPVPSTPLPAPAFVDASLARKYNQIAAIVKEDEPVVTDEPVVAQDSEATDGASHAPTSSGSTTPTTESEDSDTGDAQGAAESASTPVSGTEVLTLQHFMAANNAVRTRHNPLPDSAYAYIDEKGGGHFRIDDEKHVRLAVQLLSTSPYGPKARPKVMAAARRYGIKVAGNKEWSGIALIDNLRASLWHKDSEPDANDTPHFNLFTVKVKGEDGSEHDQLRWFGTWTNVFEDRSKDIIPTYSHKEYVEYVDREGAYPELLYWHVIGTEFGKADWMEYDGMLTHAAGYIYDDPQSQEFAIRLSEESNNGMSHGTIYREDKLTGDILQHRTFELSVLPVEYANNAGTVWLAIKGNDNISVESEDAMAFSDVKKARLKELSHLTDEQVAELEHQTEAFRDSLVKQGIKWKADDESEDSDAVPDMPAMIEAMTNLTNSVNTLQERMTQDIAQVKEVAQEALTVANRGRDDIIADALTPPAKAAHSAQGSGYVASQAQDNKTEQPNGLTVKQKEAAQEWSNQFFGMVFGVDPEEANKVLHEGR